MNSGADRSVDVAVIGGGPAGIAAAIELRRRGVQRVVILEREESAGGVPRHCGHPPFGMREFGRILTGPRYARRLVEAAIAAGVDIRTGHSVVALGEGGHLLISSRDGSHDLSARRVIIATGAREMSRAARLVSGDRPIGVMNTGALQAYIYLHGLLPFWRPMIVGTELVSLSAVLTCLKAGVRPAAMIEANARPTARRPLALFPRLTGTPMHYRSVVSDIRGGARVESVLIRRDDGAISEIACDGVLFTGCFTPESSLARMSHLTLDPGSGGPAIDQYGRCSDPAYFAAGNVLRPIETAGWCFREGRLIGRIVADHIAAAPSSSDGILVRRGEGLKFVAPQRIARSSGSTRLEYLQLRVESAIRGDLVVRAGDEVLWRKTMSALPERRILIPLRDLAIPDGASTLGIGFAATG